MNQLKLPPFQIIEISLKTCNQQNRALIDINLLWEQFFMEHILAKIPNKVVNDIIPLYTEYKGDHIDPYRVIIGCRVIMLDNVIGGMIGRTFSGGKYVQLNTQGNLHEGIVGKKWQQIWESDVDRANTADFEVYGQEAQDPENAKINFYIA